MKPGGRREAPARDAMAIARHSRLARTARLAALAVFAFAMLCPCGHDAWARGVYQTPEAFIQEVYDGNPPVVKALWLTEALQSEVARILGHKYPAARLRYWLRGGRSAWILDEVGKEEPITVGIVIDHGKVGLMRVLIFRESRGDEVRHPFFTEQFKGAALRGDRELDRLIDGISGATLSVRALTKLARLALLLHEQVVR